MSLGPELGDKTLHFFGTMLYRSFNKDHLIFWLIFSYDHTTHAPIHTSRRCATQWVATLYSTCQLSEESACSMMVYYPDCLVENKKDYGYAYVVVLGNKDSFFSSIPVNNRTWALFQTSIPWLAFIVLWFVTFMLISQRLTYLTFCCFRLTDAETS